MERKDTVHPKFTAVAKTRGRFWVVSGTGTFGEDSALPSCTHWHGPGLDGYAVLAQAAEGAHVGLGLLGQQVPAGILA